MNENKAKASKKLNNRGYTLIEALVGGTIIAICAVILVTGFITSLNLIKKGNDVKNKGQAASSIIEGATSTDIDIVETTIPGGVLSYEIGNVQYEITGNYVSAYDDTSSVGFTVFVSENQ